MTKLKINARIDTLSGYDYRIFNLGDNTDTSIMETSVFNIDEEEFHAIKTDPIIQKTGLYISAFNNIEIIPGDEDDLDDDEDDEEIDLEEELEIETDELDVESIEIDDEDPDELIEDDDDLDDDDDIL